MEGLEWLGTLIIGGIAGWLASIIMSTNQEQGILLNIVVGIIGAYIGSFVFDLLGFGVEGEIIGNLIVATAGAVILLALLKLVRR